MNSQSLTIPLAFRALLPPRVSAFEAAKSILFFYRHIRARGISTTVRELYGWSAQRVIHLLLRLPAMRKKVETEMGKAKLDIENKLVPKGAEVVRHLALPDQGQTAEWIVAEMDRMDSEMGVGPNWRHGKLSGAVYHGGEEVEKIIVAAYQRYCVSNPLHPDVFPAIRKMEAEIVSMCLRIVVPSSIHAAFDKGAAYLKIKVHTIPVDHATRKVDLKRVKWAINANTIMIAGSAVGFPDGNQDDIVALGKLATRYKIGLHVDCCLGSFIMPYIEPAGLADGMDGRYKLYPFDFRVQGVTSLSRPSLVCQTGIVLQGTSVVMYRDAELRKYQYYVNPHWSGGVYASPSISGSRPGALIAGTWAVMQYMGSEGYLESCRAIVTCARTIAEAIRTSIPELYILGSPPASVVAFGSKHPKVNVLEVGDAMGRRGWHLNALSGPAAVHIACTRLTVTMVDTFIADLKDAVKDAMVAPLARDNGLGNSSAVGPDMVGQLATAFLDALYKA
ncbi:pyridoxal phosphate-dependent transferase [Infundibulicybe gibba]|nr:pyridoxal phosphate-dependent transferase [Infundibulicybe gibba]